MFRQVVEEAITFSILIAETNGQHVVILHDVVEALETIKNSFTNVMVFQLIRDLSGIHLLRKLVSGKLA